MRELVVDINTKYEVDFSLGQSWVNECSQNRLNVKKLFLPCPCNKKTKHLRLDVNRIHFAFGSDSSR